MSVFSIIKRGREQAKEHSAKQAERVKDESVKLPYKHVPTHAATDALATVPASWKHEDRPKIREHNRRRSAMAASAHGNGGLPRVGSSSQSYVSFASVYATPVVPLPKNYSYNSIPSSWRERMPPTPEAAEGIEGMDGMDGADYFAHPDDYKGKGKGVAMPFIIGTGDTASPAFSSGRTSPLSSREVPVVVNDNGIGRAGVGIGADIGTTRKERISGFPEGVKKERRNHVSRDISSDAEATPSYSRNSSSTRQGAHRLHPSRARRTSEASTITTVDGGAGVSVDVDVGAAGSIAIAHGLENGSNSEDANRLRDRVTNDAYYQPEEQQQPSSSRSSSVTREGLHRLHPAAHLRKASDANGNSHHNSTVKTSTTSDRHYPPPAKSTYFSAPRPLAGRRIHKVDQSSSSTQNTAGQFYFNHAPSSSSASSIASIGMAISTAPTSTESTPPPSTAGDLTPTNSRPRGQPLDINASTTRPRRFSLSDRGRRSVETASPSMDERQVQAHQQGFLSRGRRLSKSRPPQPIEADPSISANRAKPPVQPVHFSRPTRAATENAVYELNQTEARASHDLITANPPTTKRGSSRRRLTKDPAGNPEGGSTPRWSFFGRRNSVTSK